VQKLQPIGVIAEKISMQGRHSPSHPQITVDPLMDPEQGQCQGPHPHS